MHARMHNSHGTVVLSVVQFSIQSSLSIVTHSNVYDVLLMLMNVRGMWHFFNKPNRAAKVARATASLS